VLRIMSKFTAIVIGVAAFMTLGILSMVVGLNMGRFGLLYLSVAGAVVGLGFWLTSRYRTA
jgi:hypothetical protein